MNRLVHYHHPQSKDFSLQYSSQSLSEVNDRIQTETNPTKVMKYPFEEPVFVLYIGDNELESATERDFDRDELHDRISELPRDSQVVAFRLIELLEAAIKGRESDEFALYKEFEPEKVRKALDRVTWGAELQTVAGEIMSNLILRHSLPNANHRTAIAMLQFCIECVAPDFMMPPTHVSDERWREWIDP